MFSASAGYSVPLEGFLYRRPKGKLRLLTDFSTSFDDVWVEELETRVVLPEGAQNIKPTVSDCFSCSVGASHSLAPFPSLPPSLSSLPVLLANPSLSALTEVSKSSVVWVEELETRVVLPEGAQNVKPTVSDFCSVLLPSFWGPRPYSCPPTPPFPSCRPLSLALGQVTLAIALVMSEDSPETRVVLPEGAQNIKPTVSDCCCLFLCACLSPSLSVSSLHPSLSPFLSPCTSHVSVGLE